MSENIELDLREFFPVLLKKIWIVALCAVILATSVLVYTVNFVAPEYQASVSIYVNNNSGVDGKYIASSDLAVALKLVNTYITIIQSDTVLDKVIEETGLLLTAGQVRGMISAETMGETEMFRVTVTTPNAQMSADLANAIAAVAPAEISAIIEGSSAKIIDYAKVPKSQSAPNYTMNAVLGGIVGAVLAVLGILLQTMTDVRVKSEEDLVKLTQIPVLGVIPQLSSEPKTTGKQKRR